MDRARTMRAAIAAGGLALLLVGCVGGPVRVERLALPATFVGTVPCGDCSGVRWTLTLRPDGEYWLERVYQGTKDGDRTYRERARWRRGDYPDLIEIFGARLGIEYLKLLPDGALQKLDNHGKAPDGAPTLLARQRETVTRFGPVRMDALYRYSADAPVIEDCSVGHKYNVVGGAAAVELERAYLALQAQGAPRRGLLAVEIAPKPAGEEGWPERVAVVGIERLTDAKVCGEDEDTTPETGAWTPVELDGEPLAPVEGVAAPRWTFGGGRFAGALPCNHATGGYTLEAAQLSFKVLATTRMACPQPAMAREQAMVEGLNAVRRWSTTDGRLELRDAEGAVRVRLRPIP